MKPVTIILTALLLIVMACGTAFAGGSDADSAATLANDAGLTLEGLRRDTGLVYDVPRASVAGDAQELDDAEGLLSCHFTDGCGYVVNPQVMIDLQYSIVSLDEKDRNLASNGLIGDRFAPNLMLGLHINF